MYIVSNNQKPYLYQYVELFWVKYLVYTEKLEKQLYCHNVLAQHVSVVMLLLVWNTVLHLGPKNNMKSDQYGQYCLKVYLMNI